MVIPILKIILNFIFKFKVEVGIAFLGVVAMLGAAVAEDITKTPGEFQNVFLIGLGVLIMDTLVSQRKKIHFHF